MQTCDRYFVDIHLRIAQKDSMLHTACTFLTVQPNQDTTRKSSFHFQDLLFPNFYELRELTYQCRYKPYSFSLLLLLHKNLPLLW
jgi:hypothetical protein